MAEALDCLEKGCESLGISLSRSQIQAFLSYLELLALWNKTFNLTSVRDPIGIVRLHFLDSLAISSFVDKSRSVMDVGSGAGFPGVPLAILYPQTKVTLVEPRRKRANFLRALARELPDVQLAVFEARIEELKTSATGLFSTVVFRAVGSAEFFLHAARRFLADRGRCLMLHGPKGKTTLSRIAGQLSGLGYANATIKSYRLPLGNEQRTLIIVEA